MPYEFGPYLLDTERGVLYRGGELLPLRPKVVDLLEVLVRRRGEVLLKDELMAEVWPDVVVDEGNLNRNVSTLRQALGADGATYIETIPRRGYRFVAEVREVGPDGGIQERRKRRALLWAAYVSAAVLLFA